MRHASATADDLAEIFAIDHYLDRRLTRLIEKEIDLDCVRFTHEFARQEIENSLGTALPRIGIAGARGSLARRRGARGGIATRTAAWGGRRGWTIGLLFAFDIADRTLP